jgi:hypothetical protein
MQIAQKIIGDLGNRNVVNVQFIAFYEEQQQIEWPFKNGQVYGERCLNG